MWHEIEETMGKAEKSLTEYKRLNEEYARKVARGEEEPDGVLYFPEYCFEFIEGEKK